MRQAFRYFRYLTSPFGRPGGAQASFLADVGHEVPTALMASLVTGTLGARADRGHLRRTGRRRPVRRRPLADDVERRRLAVGGYTATAVLFSLIGTAGNVVTVGLLRGGAWAARGLRVPARNALLADVVPASAYGRAYGFERTMDNLGAIVGPLLALGLVSVFSVRAAILISVIPGLLAALAIVYAIRQARMPGARERRPVGARANVSSPRTGERAQLVWASRRQDCAETSVTERALCGMSGRVAPAKTIGEPTYSADVLMCHREWAT